MFDPLLEIQKYISLLPSSYYYLYAFKKCNIWMILLLLRAQCKMWGLSWNESVSIYWWEGETVLSATGENDEAVMRREEPTGSVSIKLSSFPVWKSSPPHVDVGRRWRPVGATAEDGGTCGDLTLHMMFEESVTIYLTCIWFDCNSVYPGNSRSV